MCKYVRLRMPITMSQMVQTMAGKRKGLAGADQDCLSKCAMDTLSYTEKR